MDVLIVEDDKFHSELLGLIIQSLGKKVQFARSGDEAVEFANKTNFSLIFMDISMPVMDGFDAAREIRKKEKSENKDRSTIVAITANKYRDLEDRCAEAGMDAFVLKPINTKMISGVVSQVEENTARSQS